MCWIKYFKACAAQGSMTLVLLRPGCVWYRSLGAHLCCVASPAAAVERRGGPHCADETGFMYLTYEWGVRPHSKTAIFMFFVNNSQSQVKLFGRALCRTSTSRSATFPASSTPVMRCHASSALARQSRPTSHAALAATQSPSPLPRITSARYLQYPLVKNTHFVVSINAQIRPCRR